MAWKASLLCFLNSAPSLGNRAILAISSCLALSSYSSVGGNSISSASNWLPILVNVIYFRNLIDLFESVFFFYYSAGFITGTYDTLFPSGDSRAEPFWLAILSFVFQTYFKFIL